MSPEYAGYGEFSVKSDVFSFGVLVLEIVSGKKNKGFCDPGQCLNLLGHVSMNTGSPLFQCVVVPLAPPLNIGHVKSLDHTMPM